MITDTHVHIYPPEIIKNAERIAEKEPYFAQLTRGTVHRWATVDDLLDSMQKHDISESWICGFGFQDLGLCRICNDYVIESAQKWPNILKALAVVPPLDPDAESEIARCAELGAIGIGEIFPDGQHWDISDSRQTWRLAALCDVLSLFLMIHTAEPVGHSYPGKGATGPKEIVSFCNNHPELKVIFAHMGGGACFYEMMPEVRSILRNAYYDIAAAPFLYTDELYSVVLNSSIRTKVLFGSDFPILSPSRYPKPTVSMPNISMDKWSDFYKNNAKLFLNQLNKRYY